MNPLREKASKLRRDHILTAAIKVFSEKGYHRATIRDIAREAAIADGTVYASFDSKAALLMAVLDPLDEAGQAAPVLKDRSDFRGFLAGAIRHRFEAMTEEKLAVWRVLLSEALINDEIRQLFLKRVLGPALQVPLPSLDALAAARELEAVDGALAMRLIAGSVLGLIVLNLLGEPGTIERWGMTTDALSNALLDGLAPAVKGSTDE
jgi:AcrR family transcriptional regulator